MNNTLASFLLFFLLATTAYAKKETPLHVANATVQFIQNKGQITDQHGAVRRDIDVKIEGNGVTMFVGDGTLHYQWVAAQSQNSKVKTQKDLSGASGHPPSPNGDTPFEGGILSSASGPTPTPLPRGEENSDVEIYRMDVQLVGANKNAQVIFEEPTGYYENYYLAHTGEDGVRARGFQKVIYKDIYPNIDLVLYTEPNSKFKIQNLKENNLQSNIEYPTSNIKYDFIIHPGGNPADIKLRYEGATEVKLVDGTLVATTPFGSITEEVPYSYEQATGKEVASAYVLKENELSFSTGNYEGTLVIDPALGWATYYGGSGGENDPKVRTDINGYAYVGGRTTSISNIATTGAHMDTLNFGGYSHAFLVKFDSAGTRLWGTYYGGFGSTSLSDLYVDPYNNIYFGGNTSVSSGIATAGAHKTIRSGITNTEAYFAKFNGAGQRLWGTYYGGNGNDYINGITGDSNFVYIAGGTESDTGIATANAHQPSFIAGTGATGGDLNDGFFAQFNHNGQRILGTYYGGAGHDVIYDISTDKNGKVFISGHTSSDTGIASANGYDRTNGTTLPLTYKNDVFLVKFNSTGAREWGTFYGGSDVESFPKITIDNSGNIYLAASTRSTDSISSPGSNYPVPIFSIANNADMFLVKFNSNGNRTWGQYITMVDAYIGNEHYFDITTDINDHVYIGGTAIYDSTKLDPCFNQFIPSYSNATSMFFAAFDSSGSTYLSKVFSGNNQTYGGSIATHNGNDVYVAGITQATAGVATAGAHQATLGGNYDVCLYKFSIDTNVYLEQPFKDTLFCKGQSVPMKYIVTKQFKPGNVFSVQLSDTFGSFINPITIGSITATTTGTINCTIPNNILQSGNYKIRIVSTSPAITPCVQTKKIGIGIAFPDSLTASSNAPICRQDTLKLYSSSVTPGVTYAWSGPMNFSSMSDSTTIPVIDTFGTFYYVVKAGVFGCFDYDTVNVVIKALPIPPVAGVNSPVCANDTLKLTASTSTNGVSYSWNGPNNFSSFQQNPIIIQPSSAATGAYIVKAILNGCSRADTVTGVQVKDIPANTTSGSNSPICTGDTLELNSNSTTAGVTYSWTGPGGFSSANDDTMLANTTVAASGDYYIAIGYNGCVVTDTVVAIINQTPENLTAGNNGGLCTGDTLKLISSSTTGGVSYAWTGPNNYNTQNVTNPNVQLSDAGIYKITATLGNCSDTAITMVVVNQSATVNIVPTTPTTLCKGDTAQFAAFPGNAGSNPQYQWTRNGIDITGAAGNTFKIGNLNNGDIIAVKVLASTNCPLPVASNNITMTIQPMLTPTVTINADAGPSLFPNEPVNFTATATDAGSTPKYQWKRNGSDVGGATGAVWGANANFLSDGDEICVVVTSSYACPDPDTALSNCIELKIRVGVDDIVHNNNIKIYPNPVNGKVTITSTERIEKVDILNLLGQKLLTRYNNNTTMQIDMSGLTGGVYIIKVNDNHINRVVKE